MDKDDLEILFLSILGLFIFGLGVYVGYTSDKNAGYKKYNELEQENIYLKQIIRELNLSE